MDSNHQEEMSSKELEDIFDQLRACIRKLAPDLDAEGVDAALARAIYYTEHEQGLLEPLEKARARRGLNGASR